MSISGLLGAQGKGWLFNKLFFHRPPLEIRNIPVSLVNKELDNSDLITISVLCTFPYSIILSIPLSVAVRATLSDRHLDEQ